MRILIIWAESVNRRAGGSTHFWGLMHGIKSIGWQFKAIVPRYGRADVSRVEDISFVPLPPRSFFSFLLLQLVTVLCLPYWLAKYRPGVVYVRTCFLAFLMCLICRVASIPLIAEVDSIVDEEVQMRGQRRILVPILKILDRLNYRSANGLVCVTPGIREEVIRRGAEPDAAVVIHNATQTDVMRPMSQNQARQQFGLGKDGYIVGFAGTLSPWQGLDLLVQAAKQVIDNSARSVRFVVIGGGQCRQQLQEMVSRLGLGQFFSFLKPIPYEQVAVFNNACDVAVIPIYDPRKLRYGVSPLKFWDAVSVGVPVLVPEGCQLDDVLEQLSLAGTFRAGDKDNLAEAILKVLSQTERYQSRRKDVHQVVSEQYSWTCVAKKLSQLYCLLGKKTQQL